MTASSSPSPLIANRIDGTGPRPWVSREHTLLRIGAVCAVLGTVVNVAGSVGHGDLPEVSTPRALAQVAAHDSWSAVHLAGIFGVLLWLAALVALAGSIEGGAGWALARLGTVGATVGAAVHVVFFSIDGFALKAAADAWAAAPAPEQAGRLLAGDLVLLL